MSETAKTEVAQVDEHSIERQDRKQRLIAHYDALASRRQRWIERNPSFYEDEYRFMRFLVREGLRVLEIGCGSGDLLAMLKPAYGVGVDISAAMIAVAKARHPGLEFVAGDIEDNSVIAGLAGPFDVIVISDTIGNIDDCQAALDKLHRLCTAETRVILTYFNQLWRPALRFGEVVGQRMPHPPQSWLSLRDLTCLVQLAGFEVIRTEARQLVPLRLLGIGTLINRFIAPLPLIRSFCLRQYVIVRSTRARQDSSKSCTVVIPCRNERGNIESAVRRLPEFCEDQEIVFVEGHSSDGTLEECRRVQAAYPNRNIKVEVQQGKGKGDAVRLGFSVASGDVLIILDADLTVAPEDIGKFYEIIASGKGEFVNGTRLVYPMPSTAMRRLNYIANRMFALVISWLLSQRFTDTLCGTKAIMRHHYEQLAAGRAYFGEIDPFGDFDLIFGAAKLNLKIVEIPIRYSGRGYGSTQISRFRDGWLLLRMVLLGFFKMKAL